MSADIKNLVEEIDVVNEKYVLSFTGGGLRATLYCIGAYRRLVETGCEHFISEITSVSGGSIAAGVILANRPCGGYKNVEEFDRLVTERIRDICEFDIRKHVVGKFVNWVYEKVKNNTVMNVIVSLCAIARQRKFTERFINILNGKLFFGKKMSDLSQEIIWSCNATCLNTAKRFRFKQTDMYGNEIGFCEDVTDVDVALAVAASAAYPVLFAPVRLNISSKKFVDKYKSCPPDCGNPKELFLTDGGVYDNAGTEAILHEKKANFIFMDASANLENWHNDFEPGFKSRFLRILEICFEQVVLLRRRIVFNIKDSKGIQLLIGRRVCDILKQESKLRGVEHQQYEKFCHDSGFHRLEENIAKIRTDLNYFDKNEVESLLWYGALKMDVAIRSLFMDVQKMNPICDVHEMLNLAAKLENK